MHCVAALRQEVQGGHTQARAEWGSPREVGVRAERLSTAAMRCKVKNQVLSAKSPSPREPMGRTRRDSYTLPGIHADARPCKCLAVVQSQASIAGDSAPMRLTATWVRQYERGKNQKRLVNMGFLECLATECSNE